MAQGNISVKDESVARNWLAKCKANNEKLNELTKEVAVQVEAVGKASEGDIVDTFINYGNRVVKEATQLFDGVSQVANAVSSVIDLVKEGVGGFIGKAFRMITG